MLQIFYSFFTLCSKNLRFFGILGHLEDECSLFLYVVDGKAECSGLFGKTATIIVGEAAVEGDELRAIAGEDVDKMALCPAPKEKDVDGKWRRKLNS